MRSNAIQHAPGALTSHASIQARLRTATGDLTFRQIAEAAACHPESARRWLTTETRPPLWFIIALCESLRLNPHWVLTGLGSTHQDSARAEALSKAPPRLLLERLAEILDERETGRRLAPAALAPIRAVRSGSPTLAEPAFVAPESGDGALAAAI